MTIQERIRNALEAMKDKAELHAKAAKLNESVEKLITDQLIAHLGEIDNQMPEYDKHDVSHSEKVLENIEKLLREDGIKALSFLEALVLRLCCYFHDAGMILPQCYISLLEQIERDPTIDPAEGLDAWLATKKKGFADIKGQFYCPESDDRFVDFLLDQLEQYQKYRMGLPEKPEDIQAEVFFREKRHGYLRGTHGERAKVYSKNLPAVFLEGLSGSGREDLAEAVGDICASHCWEIGKVRELATKLEILSACPEMTCNVRYLAMLLRLGDVLHFSSDRVNRTVYAERDPMGDASDQHWMVKLGDLSYTISTAQTNRSIAFDGSFDDPKSYYFLQDHLNWMDEELKNYSAFVSDMHGEADAARYALGLPTEVDRSRVRATGFRPDQNLKFKLEHQKIITLLMGMRLYRDEFMCLRELYQNALDACRCMQAENRQNGLSGELEIEFGLGSDNGGDYLYCKDQGTGMTMDIVKNYLLRIGNSYYQSAEFRRANAGWGGTVAPVSEFGIGLLSCYMIASRIEVITRHYTKTNEKAIWVCMESSDDYGYFRETTRRQETWLGKHGTIVKLYLKEEYKANATGYLPESPEDAVYALGLVQSLLSMRTDVDTSDDEVISAAIGISHDAMQKISLFSYSLYTKIQKFVRVPEAGISVCIRGEGGKKLALMDSRKPYDLARKMPLLRDVGFRLEDILSYGGGITAQSARIFSDFLGLDEAARDTVVSGWLKQFTVFPCKVTHEAKKAEAYTILHLPITGDFHVSAELCEQIDQAVYMRNDWGSGMVYIDGMGLAFYHVYAEDEKQLEIGPMSYNYYGLTRPSLTVDRGNIKTVSEDVFDLERELHGMLLDEIVLQIEQHFQQYKGAVNEKTLDYLDHYLKRKFGFRSYFYMMSLLSRSVFKEYRVWDIGLRSLLDTKEICIPDSQGQRNGNDDLMNAVFGEAEHIEVNGVCITVSKKSGAYDQWDALGKEYENKRLMIMADKWEGTYNQYDIVSGLWPLVPRRLQGKGGNWQPVRQSRKYQMNRFGSTDVTSIADRTAVRPTPSFGNAAMSDVILLLAEQPEKRSIHSCGISVLPGKNGRRYIIYAFINPRPLTEKDKVYVAQYDHIPQYREGVEKGWSILFYSYKDGYVIAPGILDRMEMLKLLPREALDHDDGLEYYFTDDTFAF